MFFRDPAFAAGARATLPVLLGIVPFGVITGVAMVASGIPPCKMNNCRPALSQLLWRGAGA